jgi:hypothetical protein
VKTVQSTATNVFRLRGHPARAAMNPAAIVVVATVVAVVVAEIAEIVAIAAGNARRTKRVVPGGITLFYSLFLSPFLTIYEQAL